MTSPSTFRYHADIDLSNRNLSHTLMAELAGSDRVILDAGCADGSLGAVLRAQGCRVVGIEIDPDMAAVARDKLDEVVIGDLEADLLGTFEPSGFDVVIFGDVLEHLRKPEIVLRQARPLLGPGGFVVISIPNIAHAAVRLALLEGRFEYRPVGLLDETHVRFFTKASLQALLHDAGFAAVQVERTTAGALDTEIRLDPAAFPQGLLESLESDDEGTTYQFVVKAIPGGEEKQQSARLKEDGVWGAGTRRGPMPPDHRWSEASRLASTLIRSVAELSTLLPPVVHQRAGRGIMPRYGLDAAQDRRAYRVWLDAHAQRHEAQRQRRRAELAAMPNVPTISVLVPVYRPEEDILRRCVASVVGQDFGAWELCLSDDATGDPGTTRFLGELAAADQRIKVMERIANGGIAAATNSAAALASGDFVAFLDQDDELADGALTAVALAVAQDPTIDVLYTDEDKLEGDGSRSEPFFKPDWSPDQLISHMYIGHFLVIRRSLFEAVGGLRSHYDGSQDYDLALRVTERARTVAHVPVVAYHWRKIAGSTAQDYRAKPAADVAARAALGDAMARRGEDAVVESGLHEGTFRVRRVLHGAPLVSVIIPFHNSPELLRRCVTSLQERAGYNRWEALLVDNRSWEPETHAVMDRLQRDARCRIVPYPHNFNWAGINNHAVRHAAGDHFLFLNVDVEGKSDGWLAAMLEHSQRPEVGAVGARLLYPDGRVQHAGVVMGLGAGVAWHDYCFCPPDHPGYFGQAKVTRNCSAVTGACMMVRSDVFEALGGFDESLPVAYNDIDFCLRLRLDNHLVVYTPFAELVHEESAVRGYGSREPLETRLMWERYAEIIQRDPFFNTNLDPRRSEHALPPGLEENNPWENLLSSVEQWLKRSGKV